MKSAYIKDMLGKLGYSNEHLSENYPVQIDGTSAVRFDCVAFSDRYQKDVSTSCIAVQEAADDREEAKYLESARYLAAPIVIIFKNNRACVWNIAPQKPILLQDSEQALIELYFEENRFQFMSDHLIDAKMGYRQLNLFEASGLIDFSREATCRILSQEFEKGLVAAKKYLKSRKNINGQDLNNITSITMHIISALIINSKIGENEKVPDIFELLADLSQTYKAYFSDDLMFKYGKGLLAEIYGNLNWSINYKSVDHELLGYFYESTLLQLSEKKAENIRKKFGIYYTPRVLSQEMVRNIPFEMIPVDDRHILDGTCGSGSLLLSACKRIEDLVCYEKSEFEKHEYLTRMIEGYDIDRFASEVARLSLLLYSLPYGNKWNIHAGDLFRIGKSKIQAPYIILGNPPYEEVRGNSQKTQKAAAFFDLYLDWLHEKGYIGIILPESFLQNDSSIPQRQRLLKEFDVIELWMLPGQIFGNNCSTIVIIAQKKKALDGNVTKIKVLTRNKASIKAYFKHGKWDFEFFIDIQGRWRNDPRYKISVSPVDDVLQKISKNKIRLGDITENVIGIMMPSYYYFSQMNFDGWVPYIANANDFRRYVISPQMQDSVRFFDYHMSEAEETALKDAYKGLRLRREYESVYAASNKVLIKMSSTPGEVNCIDAFVDEEGYYPSHSFFAMVSKDKRISNDVICALINSKIINAYMRRECVKRTLITGAIRNIPVPELSDGQISELERLCMGIKRACKLEDKEKVNLLQEEIDNVMYKAFGLEPDESEKIEKLFDIYAGKGTGAVSEIAEVGNYCNVTGELDEIDADRMVCSVFLAEFGEQEIAIEASMPGWFLRKGTEFSAKYHEGKLFDIKPLMYSYLDDEELIALLSHEFSQ